MFVLEGPLKTTGFMIAGYAIAFIVMGVYVASLYIRNYNLKRDLETLESLQADEQPSKKS
jgi:hypothetical protein